MARTPKPWFRKGRGWFVTISGTQHNLGRDKKAAYHEYHRLMQWLFDPVEQISGATFDRSGTRLIWSAWDGDVRSWDLEKARELWHTPVGATYYGDVTNLGRSGNVRWRRNINDVCYPEPLYEQQFVRP